MQLNRTVQAGWQQPSGPCLTQAELGRIRTALCSPSSATSLIDPSPFLTKLFESSFIDSRCAS